MTDRHYVPTFAELCDRLSIVLLKSIFIPENRDEYRKEMALIEHDIDQILDGKGRIEWTPLWAGDIRALFMIAFANREIWLNESEARKGGASQDHLLKLSHSINGVRAQAKNVIAEHFGERTDKKVDSFAADFGENYGNWDVFGDVP